MRSLRALIATRGAIGKTWRKLTFSGLPTSYTRSSTAVFLNGYWYQLLAVRTGTSPNYTYTATIYRSANGLDWTATQTLWSTSINPSGGTFAISAAKTAFSNGTAFFCGKSWGPASPSGFFIGPYTVASPDGINWNVATGVTGQGSGFEDAGFTRLIGGPSGFLALNENLILYTSTDFISWTQTVSATSIAYGLGKFWATKRNGVDGLFSSSDVATWTPVAQFTGLPVTNIFFAGNRLVLVQSQTIASGYGARIWYSEDGTSWSESDLPSSFELNATQSSSGNLGFADSCWFYTQDFGLERKALRSTDLTTWSDATAISPSVNATSAVSDSGPFMLVPRGSEIGSTWAYVSP
jgi:hypothetical protein